MRHSALAVLILVVACSADGGPDAPGVVGIQTVCIDVACADYPEGWDVEVGETFLSFTHPSAGVAQASVGRVDMRGIVTANGGSWPAATESVVRDLWDLLAGGVGADLRRVERLPDGSVRSDGTFEGARMWHRLIPGPGSSAIGVELRAPNETWVAHADIILGGVVPVGE